MESRHEGKKMNVAAEDTDVILKTMRKMSQL